jgi:hypothetical protein
MAIGEVALDRKVRIAKAARSSFRGSRLLGRHTAGTPVLSLMRSSIAVPSFYRTRLAQIVRSGVSTGMGSRAWAVQAD